MSVTKSLNKVFNTSEVINFNNHSKFIFLSDCHRGDSSSADNFAPNETIYSSALDYYYNEGYTYIEIGDGDELWENDRFSTLIKHNLETYLQIASFHKAGRFYMIWGNHDIYKRNNRYVRKNLFQYYNSQTMKFEPLFNDIKPHEGLILRHQNTGHKIFIVHGHQGDLLNDLLWPLTRFLIRYVWRHIEILRFNNPLSPSRNVNRLYEVENGLINWVKNNNQMIICGHTHRSAFAMPNQPLYFNDGCCCHKGYITGIEIENDKICLVKWSHKPGAKDIKEVTREVLGGPQKISSYLN